MFFIELKIRLKYILRNINASVLKSIFLRFFLKNDIIKIII